MFVFNSRKPQKNKDEIAAEAPELQALNFWIIVCLGLSPIINTIGTGLQAVSINNSISNPQTSQNWAWGAWGVSLFGNLLGIAAFIQLLLFLQNNHRYHAFHHNANNRKPDRNL